MQNPPSQHAHMAMQMQLMNDMHNKFNSECWDVCFDQNLTRKELATQALALDVTKQRQMDNCQKRCMGRHFEVMFMLVGGRIDREMQQIQMVQQMGAGAK
eukprot:Tbor_TRINITY_DN5754_c1_g3::TRINITY_DN5754_c1_g3_i6::g.20828::m.20828